MRTFARSAIATADQSNAGLFRSHPCRAGLPWKTIPKNFASLITYPHSEHKRSEKWPR